MAGNEAIFLTCIYDTSSVIFFACPCFARRKIIYKIVKYSLQSENECAMLSNTGI